MVVGASIATIILVIDVFYTHFGLDIGSLLVELVNILLAITGYTLLLGAQPPNAFIARLLGLALFALVLDDYVPGGFGLIVAWELIFVASLQTLESPTAVREDSPSAIAERLPIILVSLNLAILAFIWFSVPALASMAAALGLGLIVLELARRFTNGERSDKKPHWRARLASREVLLPVLGLFAVWLLYQSLFISPRPSYYTQSMAIAVRNLYPKPTEGFRVDIYMKVPMVATGCRNPVQVTAVFSGTPDLWEHPAKPLKGTAHLALAIQSDRGLIGNQGAITNVEVGTTRNPKAPLQPETAYPSQSPHDSRVTFGPVTRSGGSLGEPERHRVSGSIKHWSSSWTPIVVSFDANWVTRRSLGSCYVRLPNLTGNGDGQSFGGALDEAVHSLGLSLVHFYALDRRVAASYGRIRLAVDGNILDDKSTPKPNSLDATQSEAIWTCSSSRFDTEASHAPIVPGKGLAIPSDELLPGGSSCGGFAVATTPWYEPFNSLALIVVGVVISMGIDFVYKELRD
jgi:hypothetical protein